MRYVYVDILALVNLGMNYVILWLTAKFCGSQTRVARLLVGAAVGALYAVISFLPAYRVSGALYMKFLFSLAIVLVAFEWQDFRQFARALAGFYLTSFFVAGTAVAVLLLGQREMRLAMAGEYVVEAKWWMLAVAGLVALVSGKAVWATVRARLLKAAAYARLTISLGQGSVTVQALVDTGNELRDPVSRLPVVIVEYAALRPILPPELQRVFEAGGSSGLSLIPECLAASPWSTRLRLIPYKSIGQAQGMLVGVRSDEVTVRESGRTVVAKDIVVAVCGETLSVEGTYRALLNPEVFQAPAAE